MNLNTVVVPPALRPWLGMSMWFFGSYCMSCGTAFWGQPIIMPYQELLSVLLFGGGGFTLWQGCNLCAECLAEWKKQP